MFASKMHNLVSMIGMREFLTHCIMCTWRFCHQLMQPCTHPLSHNTMNTKDDSSTPSSYFHRHLQHILRPDTNTDIDHAPKSFAKDDVVWAYTLGANINDASPIASPLRTSSCTSSKRSASHQLVTSVKHPHNQSILTCGSCPTRLPHGH